MKKVVGVIVLVSAMVFGYLATKDNVIMVKAKIEPHPKRYILWNKKNFAKKPGVKVMMAPMIQALGAKDVKELEGINGFSFEAKEDPTKKAKVFEQSDWVLQEEYWHSAFLGGTPVATKCYQSAGPLVEVACPAPSPTPEPTPGPSPNPTPNPTPVEPDKSWGRTRVHAKEAQALVDTSNVKACLVDTGIDLQHPNKGNVIVSQDFTGKGSAQDGAGHGTHTAGTIGGAGGIGVSKAKLIVCKGLSDQGLGTSQALAQCLVWCGQQGAQIVSNSWGSGQSDPLINQAIQSLTSRGVYVFVAAGNDSGPVNWPAKLAGSNPLVYAIAASDQSDRITSFSSRGSEIRFISPGAGIVSNWPGGGTRSLDGTSMATPHAAAICAFGVAKGIKPCVKAAGSVAGYPFADGLETAK